MTTTETDLTPEAIAWLEKRPEVLEAAGLEDRDPGHWCLMEARYWILKSSPAAAALVRDALEDIVLANGWFIHSASLDLQKVEAGVRDTVFITEPDDSLGEIVNWKCISSAPTRLSALMAAYDQMRGDADAK